MRLGSASMRREEMGGSCNLLGRRLVLRRHAAHGIGDHAIDELKRLGRALGGGPARQTRFEQSGVEQLSGKVAEEGAAGAVCAFSPGASPTMRSRASSDPKDGTAPLNQSGCARRFSSRKATRRGQSGQFLTGSGPTGARA